MLKPAAHPRGSTTQPYVRRPNVSCRPARLAACALLLSALLLVLALASVQVARADGGAPNLAYIAGGGAGGEELVVGDVSTRQVTQRIPLNAAPAAVLLSADSRSAYVTLPATNSLAVVDTSAHRVTSTIAVGPGPRGLALGYVNGTAFLYVTDSGGATLTVVDIAAQKIHATIPVGMHPSGVAVAVPGSGIAETDPNDEEVYVANMDGDSVSVISSLRQRVIATIAVPGGPLGVVIPSSGGVAYVSTRSGTVVAVSLADHRVLGTLIQLQGAPGAMDYDAVTGQIYVPDPAAGVVNALRPASDPGAGAPPQLPTEPARALPIPGGPSAVAITFDGAYGFVTERTAGHVAMFDAAAHRMLATLDVGGTPTAVITGAYPPAVSSQTALIINLAVVALVLVMMGSTMLTIARQRKKKSAGHEASHA